MITATWAPPPFPFPRHASLCFCVPRKGLDSPTSGSSLFQDVASTHYRVSESVLLGSGGRYSEAHQIFAQWLHLNEDSALLVLRSDPLHDMDERNLPGIPCCYVHDVWFTLPQTNLVWHILSSGPWCHAIWHVVPKLTLCTKPLWHPGSE